MNPFRYCQVGQSFIEELQHKVEQGNSIVLLAPRFGGKRHVVGRLRLLLDAAHVGPIVAVRLLTETPLSTTKQVQKIIRQAVTDVAPGFQSTESHADEILKPIEQLSDHLNRPILLLATNVDGMGHHLARSFLQETRDLVDRKKLVAVLSGEDDFQELVYGENSEFDCADQFVLQGYDLEEFSRFIDEYLRYLCLKFAPR
jgi:hypothetical protein